MLLEIYDATIHQFGSHICFDTYSYLILYNTLMVFINEIFNLYISNTFIIIIIIIVYNFLCKQL